MQCLYAFTLTPLKHSTAKELNQLPAGTTESPYKQVGGMKEGGKGRDMGGASATPGSGGFFFDQEVIAKSRKRQQRQQNQGPHDNTVYLHVYKDVGHDACLD